MRVQAIQKYEEVLKKKEEEEKKKHQEKRTLSSFPGVDSSLQIRNPTHELFG
jgi:hypothetical protein